MRFNGKELWNGSFNCGGYALGTLDWYLPYEDSGWDDVYSRVHCDGEDEDDVAVEMADYIIEQFPELVRRIYDLKELAEDEQAVAFRVGDADFHFMLRHRNGQWSHKPGNQPIRRIKKDDVFNSIWRTPSGLIRYASVILLLAVKRQEMLEIYGQANV